MKTPREMDRLVEEYTYYITLFLCVVLTVIVLLLVGYFIFNILSLISMGVV